MLLPTSLRAPLRQRNFSLWGLKDSRLLLYLFSPMEPVYHPRVRPVMDQTHISITAWKWVALGLPHRYEHGSCLVSSFTQSRNSAWSLGRAARYVNAHSIAGLSARRGKSMSDPPPPGPVSCPAHGHYELVYSKNLLNFFWKKLKRAPWYY